MTISEALIQRAELSLLHDALQWAPDGTIAINTSGQLTLLKPKYIKDGVKVNSKNITNDLFDVQKVDIEALPRNELFLFSAIDEVTSTIFSSVDVLVTKMKWSPLNSYNESLLAVLTSRFSLLILKNGEVWKDLTSKTEALTQQEFDENLVVSYDWAKTNDASGMDLIAGLASGGTKVFRLTNNDVEVLEGVKVANNRLVNIKAFNGGFVAVSSSNELFFVKGNKVAKLKEADRFLISDIYVPESLKEVYFTTPGKFNMVTLSNLSLSSVNHGIVSNCKITPSGPNGFLVNSDSNVTRVSIAPYKQVEETSIEPVLQKRLKKWNANYNDFNTKIYKLKIFGLELNYNGSIAAVLYEIQNVNGFRYKISSEKTFKISFIPLTESTNSNNFNINGSPLAIFQNYKLTGCFQVPEVSEKMTLDFSLELDEFLNSIVTVLRTRFIKNLILGGQDEEIRKEFAELIIKYVKKRSISFTSDIDKIVYNNLLWAANQPLLPDVPESLTLKTDSFSQTFHLNSNENQDMILSTDGLQWTRCALTFLPILTPKVRADPVTEKRIIDIERDSYNVYGNFTKSILRLNTVCIYSGSSYTTKE